MSVSDGNSRSVLRQVRSLFGGGTAAGLTDRQLLERFAARGEAAEPAFAAIVDRHGAMVLRVGRSVLRDEHDAQDAFQATFLVLARKARSLRVVDSLAPWLRGVAYRTALGARSAALRRKARERGAARPEAEPAPAQADDLGLVLHEELGRLPERFRAAVVLCCLEGLTHEQAARELGCPPGTLQSRLARGRARLRDRLVRRGLAPSAAWLLTEPGADASALALPAGYASLAVRAGLSVLGTHRAAVGPAAAALAKEVVSAMIVTKLKALTLGAAVLGVAALGARGYAFQSRDDQEGVFRQQMEQRIAPFFREASRLPKEDQERLWVWLSHDMKPEDAIKIVRSDDRLEPMLKVLRMVAPEKADRIREQQVREAGLKEAAKVDKTSEKGVQGQGVIDLVGGNLSYFWPVVAPSAVTRWEYKVIEANSPNNLERDLNEWSAKGWDVHQTMVQAYERINVPTFTAVLRRPTQDKPAANPAGGLRP